MKRFYGILLAGLLSVNLSAQELDMDSDSKVKLSGFGYYMFGQIMSGVYGDDWEGATTTFEHLWNNTSLLHINLESSTSDWFTTRLGLEFYVTFPLKGSNAMNKASYFRTYKAYLAQAEGIMHWDYDYSTMSSLTIRTGMLPHTINPQVKTLGNYLFRSTIHPVSVQNKLDYPWADLLGGVVTVGLLEDKVKIEGIIASEFNYVPFFDFTPAFGAYYKPNEVIDIGGAIAFHHALQANVGLMPDSLGAHWQGTKIDARAIFDPKPLLGGMDYLGKDEFKIYAELGILGFKDTLEVDTSNIAALESMDTTGLDVTFPTISLKHRMPFMLGINFPTWKILDLLSLELEWFYSPYANDWFGKFDSQKAEARQPTALNQWDIYINKDNFKWSVNIRKSVEKFEARAIFGKDHTIYTVSNLQTGNFEQTMKRPQDWHWMIQLRYNL